MSKSLAVLYDVVRVATFQKRETNDAYTRKHFANKDLFERYEEPVEPVVSRTGLKPTLRMRFVKWLRRSNQQLEECECCAQPRPPVSAGWNR